MWRLANRVLKCGTQAKVQNVTGILPPEEHARFHCGHQGIFPATETEANVHPLWRFFDQDVARRQDAICRVEHHHGEKGEEGGRGADREWYQRSRTNREFLSDRQSCQFLDSFGWVSAVFMTLNLHNYIQLHHRRANPDEPSSRRHCFFGWLCHNVSSSIPSWQWLVDCRWLLSTPPMTRMRILPESSRSSSLQSNQTECHDNEKFAATDSGAFHVPEVVRLETLTDRKHVSINERLSTWKHIQTVFGPQTARTEECSHECDAVLEPEPTATNATSTKQLDTKSDDLSSLEWQSIAINYEAAYDNAVAVSYANRGEMLSAISLWMFVVGQQGVTIGHDKALFNLGLCYQLGMGIQRDELKAAEYYSKAADLGCSKAAYNLAIMRLESGDDESGVELLSRAAEHGLAEAQRELGVLLMEDARLDRFHAAELFQLAATQQDAKACFYLGICYERGLGLDRDEAKAVQWYKTAAALGHTDAILNLSLILERSASAKEGTSPPPLSSSSLSGTESVTGERSGLSIEPKISFMASTPNEMTRKVSSGTLIARLLSTGSDAHDSSSFDSDSDDGSLDWETYVDLGSASSLAKRLFYKPLDNHAMSAAKRSKFFVGDYSSEDEDEDQRMELQKRATFHMSA